MALKFSQKIRVDSYLQYSDVIEATETVYDPYNSPAKQLRTVRFFDVFKAPVLEESSADISYLLQSSDRLDKLAKRYYGKFRQLLSIAYR